MKATMLLADAASTAEGKLYVLGAGWNITGPPSPSAIALYIEVPWDRTNRRVEWSLELVDSDGQPVTAPDAFGNQQPIVLRGDFEVGRPAGVPPGAPIGVALALNLGPLPLAPASRYEWRLTLDEESKEDWRAAFSTRTGWTYVG